MASNENSDKNLIRLNENQQSKALAPTAPGSGMVLPLGGNAQLDLSGLTEEQQQQLKFKYAEGMIAVNRKAQELVADAGALNHTLGTMAHHTEEVAASGQDVTITHTQDSSLGRTEVIMGTSDAAKKGKLTRSQTGQPDQTLLYVGVAVFIVVIIGLVMIAMSR